MAPDANQPLLYHPSGPPSSSSPPPAARKTAACRPSEDDWLEVPPSSPPAEGHSKHVGWVVAPPAANKPRSC